MNWTQLLALILGNAAIIIPLWLHLEAKMDEQARRLEDMMREFKKDWATETKDFHGRLCSLEQKIVQKG